MIRFVSDRDLEQVVDLQDDVLRRLPEPWPLYARDHDFFARCVADAGCVVGAFHGERLAAYATMYVPQSDDENYGVDLGFRDHQLGGVAHLAGSAVHPRYRGNRLQTRLANLRDTFARRAGFRHLCGEVVPGNFISIRNHLALGYYLKGFRIDCFDEPNFMLDKDLHVRACLRDASDLRIAPADGIREYRAMIRDGLWGFRTVARAGTQSIVFGRFA